MANKYDSLFGNTVEEPQQSGNSEQPNKYDEVFATAPDDDYWDQDHGAFMAGIEGFNRHIERFTTGVMQLGSNVANYFGADTSEFDQKMAAYNQQMEQENAKAAELHPIAQAVGAGVAEIGKGAMMGNPVGGLGKQVLGYAGRAGLEGAAEYGTPEERMMRGGIGAAVGGAIPLVGEGLKQVAKPIAKSLFKGADQLDEAAGAINAGHNITLGQATGSEGLQSTENFLSKIPGIAAKGNVKKAAASLNEQVEEGLEALGTSRKPEALSNSVLESIQNLYKKNSDEVDKVYKAYYDELDKVGGKIPLTKTQDFITKEASKIDELSKSFKSAEITDSNVKDLLSDFTTNKIGFDENGIKTVSSRQFEGLRQNINGILQKLYKGSTDQKMIEPISKLKGLMDDDLQAFSASKGGDLLNKAQAARSAYQELKAPFKSKTNAEVARVLKEGNPDKIWNALTTNDSPHITKFLMDNLEPQDQMNFTSALFGKAVRKATNRHEMVELPKLAEELHKMRGTIDALPENIQTTVKGIKKLITGSEELFKKNKLTSSAAWGTAAGTVGLGAFGSLSAGISTAAFTKALSIALTNPHAVKGIVKLAGGKLKPAVEKSIKKQVFEIIFKSLPTSIGSNVGKASEEMTGEEQ